MTKAYSSFLIRCWDLQGARPRIQVEHIQSGEQACLDSFSALEEWISVREQQAGPRGEQLVDGSVFPIRVPAGSGQD
jgi:hypothetical protein